MELKQYHRVKDRSVNPAIIIFLFRASFFKIDVLSPRDGMTVQVTFPAIILTAVTE